MHQSV